jgi:hypothetical protein
MAGLAVMALASSARAQVSYVDEPGAVAPFSVFGGPESEEEPEPLKPEERS